MVASALLKQSAEETGVAAQRIVHHGADLSSKARKSANDARVSEALWSNLRKIIPGEAAAANGSSCNNNNNNSDYGVGVGDSVSSTMTVRSGTTPYESQLRKKRQRQQQQQEITTKTDIEAKHLRDEKVSNPYLFHQQTINDDSNIDIRRVEGDGLSNSPPLQNIDVDNTNATDPLESNDAISTTISSPVVDNSDPAAVNTLAGEEPATRLREGQAVPSTRVGRAFGFATLGAGLAWGAVGELTSRMVGGGSTSNGNALTTDANADRLAATLCRMRGAALKMGQMLSIQDESLLPPALTRALKQVRQGADAMPNYQLVQQLRSELGDGSSDDETWRNKFESFDDRPFAAASIGQVHRATVVDKDTGEIKPVVVKVQYPGVAQSIESDLGNLAMLVRMTGLTPKGLFIENVMRVGRDELKVECNYLNEMANQEAFQTLVHSDPVLRANKFVVPEVIEDVTTELVITTGYAPGGTIDKVSHLDQEERNRIGRTILYLTMQELFEWRLMQTDPNWGNFLYDVGTGTTTLIDFGATREFPKSFVDGYLRIVWASANRDETTLMKQSRAMGFLTGEENEIMLNAHKLSGFTVGEPFWNDEPFDFQRSQISTRMGEHTSVFLRHRLT